MQGNMNNRGSIYAHSIQGIRSNEALTLHGIQWEKVGIIAHEWNLLVLFVRSHWQQNIQHWLFNAKKSFNWCREIWTIDISIYLDCIQGMGSNEAATLNGVQRKKQNPNKFKEIFFIQFKGTTCDLEFQVMHMNYLIPFQETIAPLHWFPYKKKSYNIAFQCNVI